MQENGELACYSDGRSPLRRLPSSELLQRVFGVDALRCPCGERMRILAVITDPAVAERILACKGLPPRAPPLGPVASPKPHPDSWLDGPEGGFDQTPPSDWDLDA